MNSHPVLSWLPSVTEGVPVSGCPAQVSPLSTAAVCLVRVGLEQRGWLFSPVTVSVLQPGPGCTVYQVDLFTLREEEAKCLATRVRGQDNSLPVVLENYSSKGVFTRRLLLILVTVFRSYLFQ